MREATVPGSGCSDTSCNGAGRGRFASFSALSRKTALRRKLFEDLEDLFDVGVLAIGWCCGIVAGTGGTSIECENELSAVVLFDLTDEGISVKSFIFEGILRRFSLEGVLSRLLREGVRFKAFELLPETRDRSCLFTIVSSSSSSSSGDLARISTPSSDSTQ